LTVVHSSCNHHGGKLKRSAGFVVQGLPQAASIGVDPTSDKQAAWPDAEKG